MSLTIDLEGRKALVTGVSGGVGAGIARRLLDAGCEIVGCARSKPETDGVNQFLSAGDGRAHYLECDVTDGERIEATVAEAATLLGGLDLVVSNAGVNVFTGVSDCSEEDWQHNLDLNLASHWRLARAARPYLDQSPHTASFIVITSNHAFSTIAGCFPYNLAKTALTGLVRSLALEWGPKIRCVGVAPGFIKTEGNRKWFESFPDPAAERARTEAAHPAGRLGTPEEVGALCAFLASEHGAFFTGTTILQDGGRSAVMQDDNPFENS
ncbi:MAG: SDR family oxidoreductase [Verrucomicrobiota bacterium]